MLVNQMFGSTMRSGVRCVLSLALIALFAGAAWSQIAYREHRINDKYKNRQKLNELRKEKLRVLRGDRPFAVGQSTLDEFYKKYFFLAMTMEEYRGQLAKMRSDLQKDMITAGSGPAYDYLRNLAFAFCRQLAAKKEYHPAVRYNAMLIVGSLNQSEANLREGRPAAPYAKALGALVNGVKATEDAVRMAALIGLKRHAELSDQPGAPAPMSDRIRQGVTKYLLPVIAEATVPAGRDDEAHDWMRRTAVQALGYLRPRPEQEVLKTLIDVMRDKSADKNLRCQCAETLGRLKLEDSGIPAAKLARAIAVVAADCCRYEVAQLGELVGPGQRGSGRFGRGPPRARFNPPQGDEGEPRQKTPKVEDERTMPSRRRLLERLVLLQRGLAGDSRLGIGGVAAMSDGATAISTVRGRISDMILAIQKTEDPLITYGSRLNLALRALQPNEDDLEDLAPIKEQESMPTEENVAAGS